jgi:hypothetical protein
MRFVTNVVLGAILVGWLVGMVLSVVYCTVDAATGTTWNAVWANIILP